MKEARMCSEMDTNGRKWDASMLFKETARNGCCLAEGGINPSKPSGLDCFITGY
jgi:hypothetical protein